VGVCPGLPQSQNRRPGDHFVRRCLPIFAGVAVNLAVKFYGGIGVAAAEAVQSRASTERDSAGARCSGGGAAWHRVRSRPSRASGYAVHTAANGTEAMKLIEEQTFDLLLLDINMPGPNGIQVLQAGCCAVARSWLLR
jgi:hypothetical protein